MPTPVASRVVNLESAPIFVRAWGNLHAVQEVALNCERGGKVAWLHPELENGLHLAAGTEIMRLDQHSFELAEAQAQAGLAMATAQEAAIKSKVFGARRNLHIATQQEVLAERELVRVKKLFTEGDASQSLLDQAQKLALGAVGSRETAEYGLAEVENSLRALEAATAQAQVALQQAQDSRTRSRVSAPFEGELGSLNLELGAWIAPGLVFGRLINRSQLQAELQVPAEDCAVLKLGQAVELKTAIGPTLVWQVVGIDPEVSLPNRSRQVTVICANPQNLIPAGAHVEATIFAENQEEIWIRPAEYSLVNGVPQAWLINAQNSQVTPSDIKLGRPRIDASGGTWLPVLNGLSSGQQIAIDNLEALSANTLVSVIN